MPPMQAWPRPSPTCVSEVCGASTHAPPRTPARPPRGATAQPGHRPRHRSRRRSRTRSGSRRSRPIRRTNPASIASTRPALRGDRPGRSVTGRRDDHPSSPFVMGVVAGSIVGGGDAGVHHESIFSTGCIYNRSKIQFEGHRHGLRHPRCSALLADHHRQQRLRQDVSRHQQADPRSLEAGAQRTAPWCCRSTRTRTSRTTRTRTAALWHGTPCDNFARSTGPGGFGNLSQFNDSSSIAYNYPSSSLIASDASAGRALQGEATAFTQAQLDQLKAIAISQNNYYTSRRTQPPPTQRLEGPD